MMITVLEINGLKCQFDHDISTLYVLGFIGWIYQIKELPKHYSVEVARRFTHPCEVVIGSAKHFQETS